MAGMKGEARVVQPTEVTQGDGEAQVMCDGPGDLVISTAWETKPESRRQVAEVEPRANGLRRTCVIEDPAGA